MCPLITWLMCLVPFTLLAWCFIGLFAQWKWSHQGGIPRAVGDAWCGRGICTWDGISLTEERVEHGPTTIYHHKKDGHFWEKACIVFCRDPRPVVLAMCYCTKPCEISAVEKPLVQPDRHTHKINAKLLKLLPDCSQSCFSKGALCGGGVK